MKMHGPKNKKDFIAIIITFYTHSYGLILPKVPFETNYQFSHKTAFRIFIACVDVWNVKSGVSTTTKIWHFKPKISYDLMFRELCFRSGSFWKITPGFFPLWRKLRQHRSNALHLPCRSEFVCHWATNSVLERFVWCIQSNVLSYLLIGGNVFVFQEQTYPQATIHQPNDVKSCHWYLYNSNTIQVIY